MENNVSELYKELIKSNWPNSEKIAKQLFIIGNDEAKNALVEGLNAKRHAIRTACVRYLAEYNDKNLVELIKKYLSDSSYETRMEAKKAIKKLTGDDVLTARGE